MPPARAFLPFGSELRVAYGYSMLSVELLIVLHTNANFGTDTEHERVEDVLRVFHDDGHALVIVTTVMPFKGIISRAEPSGEASSGYPSQTMFRTVRRWRRLFTQKVRESWPTEA